MAVSPEAAQSAVRSPQSEIEVAGLAWGGMNQAARVFYSSLS